MKKSAKTLEEVFSAELDANSADWFTRSAYADWLDEQGRDQDAATQRWMVANQKCPFKGYWEDARTYWDWFPTYDKDSDTNIPRSCMLPEELYNCVGTETVRYAQYRTRIKAEAALARVLLLSISIKG